MTRRNKNLYEKRKPSPRPSFSGGLTSSVKELTQSKKFMSSRSPWERSFLLDVSRQAHVSERQGAILCGIFRDYHKMAPTTNGNSHARRQKRRGPFVPKKGRENLGEDRDSTRLSGVADVLLRALATTGSPFPRNSSDQSGTPRPGVGAQQDDISPTSVPRYA